VAPVTRTVGCGKRVFASFGLKGGGLPAAKDGPCGKRAGQEVKA